eukprot:444981_1
MLLTKDKKRLNLRELQPISTRMNNCKTLLMLMSITLTAHSDPDHIGCPIHQIMSHALQINTHLQKTLDTIEDHWHHNPYFGVRHTETERRRLQSTLPNPLTIPLNIHIIKMPDDQYIGYEQIISQIRVLNEFFMKLLNYTTIRPKQYASLVGDFGINFALNQIIRKDTPVILYEPWPGDINKMKYTSNGGSDTINPLFNLNIWVHQNSYLGFAYYPGISRDIDGVVVRPHVFGSKQFDHHSNNISWDIQGTKTHIVTPHEVGHWLNLKHIWGQQHSCSYDDGVIDTPVSDGPNWGCPIDEPISCGNYDMFMNVMDYTNNDCRKMFTYGQVDRGLDLFESVINVNCSYSWACHGWRQDFTDYDLNPTDITFVDYFYFIYGHNSECDIGHIKRDINVNQGTNGDYIYLCVSYSNNPHVSVITNINIISGDNYGINCVNSEYVKIDTNLNENAGGSYLYICYKKETQETPDNTFVTDLNVFVFDNELTDLMYFDGFTLIATNLNDGILDSNKWIYLGYKTNCDYVTTPMTYEQAETYCVNNCGLHLSSIKNSDDINKAKLLINGGIEPWIGLHNTKESDLPQWFEFYDNVCPNTLSGACVDFWVDHVPKCKDKNGYDCTVLYYDSMLVGNDKSCQQKRPFLCTSFNDDNVDNAMKIVKHLDDRIGKEAFIGDNNNNNDTMPDYLSWIVFWGIISFILINNIFVCWYFINKSNKQGSHQSIKYNSV